MNFCEALKSGKSFTRGCVTVFPNKYQDKKQFMETISYEDLISEDWEILEESVLVKPEQFDFMRAMILSYLRVNRDLKIDEIYPEIKRRLDNSFAKWFLAEEKKS